MGNDHDPAGGHWPRGTFAEGQADPVRYPESVRIGRFSDGQAHRIADLDAGRFSADMEALGAEDAEKYVVGSFGDEQLAA